jgi:hypothetical protein
MSEDSETNIELMLPRDVGAHDYMRQIQSVLRILADIEDRTPEKIIFDIRMIGVDLLQSRIPDALVHDDTIHLEVASGYVDGIRRVLAANATTELDPAPFFLRVLKDATTYANRCRFGHTFRGSFGFTVESPIVPNDHPTLDAIPERPPFERRVMERFARGIADLNTAVESNDTKPMVEGSKTGFSANVCEQLAQLVENTAGSGLILGFKFSPEWRTSVGVVPMDEYKIGPRHIEVMEAAAKALRQQAPPTLGTVFGRVTKLQTDADPSDLLNPSGQREVEIQWLSPDLGEVSVKVSLSASDYLTALEAHRAGRPVMVSGTLERSGRRGPWILTSPGDFLVPG